MPLSILRNKHTPANIHFQVFYYTYTFSKQTTSFTINQGLYEWNQDFSKKESHDHPRTIPEQWFRASPFTDENIRPCRLIVRSACFLWNKRNPLELPNARKYIKKIHIRDKWAEKNSHRQKAINRTHGGKSAFWITRCRILDED